MNPSDEIANLLAGLKAQGLSDERIARMSHVTRTTLARCKSGAMREPLLSTYLRLASTYERSTGRPCPPLKLR